MVTECAKVTKAGEREAFVRNEVRQAGGKIDSEAVATLIDAVGTNLRELAAAAVAAGLRHRRQGRRSTRSAATTRARPR